MVLEPPLEPAWINMSGVTPGNGRIFFPQTALAIRFFFFQAEDGIRGGHVTEVQTCALPISPRRPRSRRSATTAISPAYSRSRSSCSGTRSEEHTSELQSRGHLVCRLLL